MKKALFIMAAALLTMTQCRKENATPNMPADGAVKMTVTAGPGRTDINTATGAITWSEGDRLYVSDGTNWLGSLTLEEGAGTANGTFTGNVTGLDDEGDACHFFYLGHDNGMEEPTASSSDPVSISFAAQDGTLAGAMKYHAGYGRTDVTVTEGEATGSVIMNTKIAIAHINFTDGTSAYTGSLTMGGTGIFNTLSVNPDGTFSGSGDEGITIGNGGGTTGERYVTLIPTETTEVLNVSFTGDATGGMTFAKGIHENKFYGMSNAIEVTVEASTPKFTVAAGTTVEFAPGNLYYDGSSWKFEANQWDFRTYAGKNSCIGGSVTADGTPSNHWGLFGWSTSSTTYGMSTSQDPSTYSGDFVDWCTASGLPSAGEGKSWRTLSKAEWDYLLNSRTNNASSLRAWKDFGNNVKGLVILPDGTDASVMSSITSTDALATYGAVFLPAAGDRDGTGVKYVGSYGYYWSSTPLEDNESYAYYMYFGSGKTGYAHRYNGCAVRLVR